MTVATVDTTTGELAVPEPTRGAAAIAQWVPALEAAVRIAEVLVQSSFVPAAYRNKPHEAAAAMLAGAVHGFDPVASLNAWDNIQGTPAPKANTVRAILLAQGHRIRWRERTGQAVEAEFARHLGGGKYDEPVVVRWTLDDAKAAGLTGKDNWRKNPRAMLTARVTTEGARLIAPDGVLGVAMYSAEELRDGDVIAGEVVTEPSDRPAYLPATQDTGPGPAPDGQPADARPSPITAAQSRALHAGLQAAGLGDRTLGLAWCSDVLGRALESTRDLTRDEASRLIDEIKTRRAPQGPRPDGSDGMSVGLLPDDHGRGDPAPTEDPS
jgi:hypothetical protein